MRRVVRLWLGLVGVTLAGASGLPAQASPAAAPPAGYPTKDRWGKPLPPLTFYCQYKGLARDASGKYPLYQNAYFTMATTQGAISSGWKRFIETTYRPTSEGSAVCALLPDDPVERDGVLKGFNLLTQPATQIVVTTAWTP